MSYSCIERLNTIKAILSDLYPIIRQEWNKQAGFAATFVFNNLVEECWKLMNELLTLVYGYSRDDQQIKGPSKTISVSFEVGLIDNPRWKKMLLDRNNTTHDYRNQNIEYYFHQIKNEYIHLVENLVETAEKEINNLDAN